MPDLSHMAPCFKYPENISALILLHNSKRSEGKTCSRLDIMEAWDFPVKGSALLVTLLNLPKDVATIVDGCFP